MNSFLICLEIFILFIVPVLPSFFNRVPKKYRFHLFAAIILIAATIVLSEHWSLNKLGIDLNNISNGLPLYFIFTVAGLIYIFALAKILKYKPTPNWWNNNHFLFGFILMSIGQEFLYRGFLMPDLKLVFSSVIAVVLINALLFTFIHIIYPNRKANLITAFIGGLCFAGIYYYYPNLILISISHMILNFAVVYFGMFTFKDDELV